MPDPPPPQKKEKVSPKRTCAGAKYFLPVEALPVTQPSTHETVIVMML